MAGIFRFSNAVSDIGKFIQTYRSLYNHFYTETSSGRYFDHKQASEYLATNGLASSLGAIGEEAVRRSRREDTSRDPLYNQHKMYSEIYRMLGWYEPGSKKTNFNLPEYGDYIANNDNTVVAKLFALNILHIVSPNPLTTIRGGNILRPFPLILKMMGALDGYLSRDEMILTVLACPNDRIADYVDDQAERIKDLRSKDLTYLNQEIHDLMDLNDISSDDVLPNYTRFPIAAMKWTGWATARNDNKYYKGKNIKYLILSDDGNMMLDSIINSIDIRYEDIMNYSDDEKAAFVVWSNLYQLGRAGFNVSEYKQVILTLKSIAKSIFDDYQINDDKPLLFFGYQEAPRSILRRGDELIGD